MLICQLLHILVNLVDGEGDRFAAHNIIYGPTRDLPEIS
jgi:hypothetical protein